ncbi:MAG: hypothetical protein SWH54_07670 [Thermodesulfobacteriota bacterium]|nr:hypothetical protein [Thermodesulfobacteriota bacterium]
MSWFYHYVKETLADKYDVYLQASFTKPGEFCCTGGCDSITSLKRTTNKYYICEIKSIDENPITWLKHPDNEAKNNPEQFEVREYWIKKNKTNNDVAISHEVFAWAFVITGQLEQYFSRNCTLKYKSHKKMQGSEKQQVPSLPANKKRALIFDSYYKETIQKTIKILNLTTYKIEEIHNGKRSWLTVCILKFDKPETTNNHRWFIKK